VVHSATKYLGGHGDVLAGVVAGRDELIAGARTVARVGGAILGPFEAWLVMRGLRTLPLRLDRQCANAAALAGWLAGHPCIARVHYPGLPDHPDHGVARKLLPPGRFGAMVSFEIAGAARHDVERFIDSVDLCLNAATLGDLSTGLS